MNNDGAHTTSKTIVPKMLRSASLGRYALRAPSAKVPMKKKTAYTPVVLQDIKVIRIDWEMRLRKTGNRPWVQEHAFEDNLFQLQGSGHILYKSMKHPFSK